MKKGGALLLADALRAGIGVVIAVPGENHLGAVALGGLYLGNGGGLGHDDGGGNTQPGGRVGYALGMVPGGGSHHGAVLTPLSHGGNFIAGSANLKGTGFLPVFTFEVYLPAGHGGKGRGAVKLRMVDNRPQALRRTLYFAQFYVHTIPSQLWKNFTPNEA